MRRASTMGLNTMKQEISTERNSDPCTRKARKLIGRYLLVHT